MQSSFCNITQSNESLSFKTSNAGGNAPVKISQGQLKLFMDLVLPFALLSLHTYDICG